MKAERLRELQTEAARVHDSYGAALMVCAGTACVANKSMSLIDHLKRELMNRGLTGKYLVVPTGCNGFCAQGPIMVVQPEGVFYQKLKPEDLGLELDSTTEGLISLGHKKLISKENLRAFALIEGQAHTLVEARSFPFLNGIARFLPNGKLDDVTSRLGELEREFRRTTELFLDRYAEIREDGLREWSQAAMHLVQDPEHLLATIRGAFPAPERMQRYFEFSTQLFQIQLPESLDLRVTSAGEQRDIAAARQRVARDAAERINHGVEEFVSDCVPSLRQQTAQLCDEMLQSMQSGKTGVHPNTC